jgi:hypothetical protein
VKRRVLRLNVYSESTISITNSPLGILVGAGKIISPDGVGTFVIENNGVGLDFGLDGTALLVGGLTGTRHEQQPDEARQPVRRQSGDGLTG